jgi:hypothetical protein
MPSRQMRPIVLKMSRTVCGASVALGSSSSIIFGCDINPRPMQSICNSPPDRVAAVRDRFPFRASVLDN